LEAREVVKKKYDEFRQKRKELIGAEMELYDAV
jgi:hypothetical protein